MKKTTKYARKIAQGKAGIKDLGAALDTICSCRPYTSEVVPGSWVVESGTQSSAVKAMLHVRECFESLKTGHTAPDNTNDFNTIGHAIGVAVIRAKDIENSGPMLLSLLHGHAAMQRCLERWETIKLWGFDGPAIHAVTDAIEVYEAIIQASSPRQMYDAMTKRMDWLEQQRKMKAAK